MTEYIVSSEANEQETFIAYMRVKRYPVYANVNENIWSGIVRAVLPQKKALRVISMIERKMKSLGKKKGVPDLFIPIMSKGYGGMYIEFKYGKNKTTKEQDAWIKTLSKNGYYCAVCYSAKEAIAEFERYIN